LDEAEAFDFDTDFFVRGERTVGMRLLERSAGLGVRRGKRDADIDRSSAAPKASRAV
jgi:hypothetical protein